MADKARRPYLAMDLDDFRKPGTVQRAKEDSFVRMPSRYLATSLDRESEFEKPYYDGSPRKMHLDWPVWDWPSINPITFHPGETPKGYSVVGGCPHCALAFDPITDCVEDWAEAHAMIYCSMQPGTDCPDCTMQITAIVGKIIEIAPGTWSRRSETAVVLSSSDYTYDPKTGQTKVKQPPIPGTMSLKVKVDPLIEKHILIAEMVDGGGNYCMADLEVECEVCNCDDPPSALTIVSYDSTIDPGGNAYVTISGGCGPYQYAVAGTGYTSSGTDTVGTITSAAGVCGVDYSPTVTVTVTDRCTTSVSCKIKNTGGTWESIGGFGVQARCQSGVLCNACNDGSPCGSSYTIYHSGVGSGGAYQGRWVGTYVATGCGVICQDINSYDIGIGSSCGQDTLYINEIPLGSEACMCEGTLYYWTCGADCT